MKVAAERYRGEAVLGLHGAPQSKAEADSSRPSGDVDTPVACADCIGAEGGMAL